jgi:triacylglycerol lipase
MLVFCIIKVEHLVIITNEVVGMSKHIILAHGFVGFGGSNVILVNYFNGIEDHLSSLGHKVLSPQVNPIGSVKRRGEQLAEMIKSQLPVNDKAHIIAHSMGGLDARYALSIDHELAE